MFEKLTHLLVRRHSKLKNWHAVWNVGKFIAMLARKNEKLARFWHADTQTRKPLWHETTSARKPRWQAGTHGTWFSKLINKYLYDFEGLQKKTIFL